MVYVQMRQTNFYINDTSGFTATVSKQHNNFEMIASSGSVSRGIVVGTGTTPVAIDDYALESQIAEGTGVDEMNHLTCTVATSIVAAPSCSFVVSRSIVNNSAAEITVREAAIYTYSGIYNFCLIRDVFGTPQTAPIDGMSSSRYMTP